MKLTVKQIELKLKGLLMINEKTLKAYDTFVSLFLVDMKALKGGPENYDILLAASKASLELGLHIANIIKLTDKMAKDND